MKRKTNTMLRIVVAVMAGLGWIISSLVQAAIPGVSGTTFNLTAKTGFISIPDSDSVFMWGFSHDGPQTLHNEGRMQYPGPTLIVNQGDTVTIQLTNSLPATQAKWVSIVFPGQSNVTAVPVSGPTRSGLMTEEAGTGATVEYSFTATHAGTYLYHSGTDPELQTEMGLTGALIVRPTGFVSGTPTAYGASTAYDLEYMLFLTQIDPEIHNLAELGKISEIDMSTYFPVNWFINGRNLPDDLFPDFIPWLPNQPYGALVRMHPGDIVLTRYLSGSRYTHPFHPHGNNILVWARDGRLLSTTGTTPDLAFSEYTLPVPSFSTFDTTFEWTGQGLGWDIYGPVAHTCDDLVDNKTGLAPPDGFDDAGDNAWEYCADHNKTLPVTLPELGDFTFGGFWRGSPFLNTFGELPPGEGGLNLNGGFTFPWHSHSEKELANNDIFPGGMFTVLIVEPPAVSIP